MQWPKNFDPKLFAVPNFCNDSKTLTQIISLTKLFWPKFCTDPKILTLNFLLTQIFAMTQKFDPNFFFDPKFFAYSCFCNDPKTLTQNFSLTQIFAMTQNFSLTQIFAMTQKRWPKILLWPKIFRWPKFLQWLKNVDSKFFADPNFLLTHFCNDPKTLTQNFTLTQIFWPKINGDPKFDNDLKFLTQKFWVKGLWPEVFSSAAPKNFNSVKLLKKPPHNLRQHQYSKSKSMQIMI